MATLDPQSDSANSGTGASEHPDGLHRSGAHGGVTHQVGHRCHEHHPHGEFHRTLDRVGAVASFLCAIHCAVMPVLVVLLPTAAVLGFAENHTLEGVFVGFSAVLATTSLSLGYRHHGRRDIFLLLGLALIALLSSRFFHGTALELTLLVGGALGITTCHVLNRRWCQAITHR